MVETELTVWREGDEYFAFLAGGWWSARGKTAKQAIDKVLKAAGVEMNMEFELEEEHDEENFVQLFLFDLDSGLPVERGASRFDKRGGDGASTGDADCAGTGSGRES